MMKLYDVIRKEQLDKGIDIEHREEEHPHVPVHESERKKFSWKKVIIIALALALLALLYIGGMRFVHAKVTIVERKIPISLDKSEIELTNEKVAGAGRLTFQVMAVNAEVTREVYGSTAQASSTKAQGNAVFFNEYSTSAQTIKSGTTLTGANGKKYITQAAVTVPGYTGSGKTKKIGSSAPVAITAADIGDVYNSTGTTFTIDAYSGTKAKQLYARSAGSIKGGTNGAVHALSDNDKKEVVKSLEAQITERLKRETRAQIPENQVTFPDLQFVSIDTENVDFSGESIKFPVTIKGTMVSYLIPRDLFESSVAKEAIKNYMYPDVSIPAINDLTVEPVSAIPGASTTNIPDTITVSVSGSATVITKVPAEKVKELLVGIPRGQFSHALTDVPEIDSAHFKFNPFWAPYFPKSQEDITIKTE